MDMYPEHEKLKVIQLFSQSISNFIDWLNEQGIELCEYDHLRRGSRYFAARKSKVELIATYFEIDLARLEAEKVAMLAEAREVNILVERAS